MIKENAAADTTQAREQPMEYSQNHSYLKYVITILLILLAVFAAYSPALSGDFVWDDRNLIERPDSIHQIQPLMSYFHQTFWNTTDQARLSSVFYRPLVTLSYAVEWQLWEGRPFGFHLTNIFIHLLNCILVFCLARKWGAKTRDAFAGMALFGLLPRLSESVAWISGRTDTLAAFFTLSALAVYPHLRNQKHCRSLAQGIRIIVSALLILAGLFCKEVASAGLAAIAAWEFSAFLRRESAISKSILRLSPFLLISLFYFWLRLGAMAGHGTDGFRLSLEFAHHASIIFAAIGIYLRMALFFFLPEFQIGSIDVPSPVHIALGILFTAGIFLILFKIGLKKFLSSPLFSLAALCFAPLILVIHILPLKMVSMTADRFIYVPAAAFSIALALTFNCISPDKYRRISVFKYVLFGAVLCTCFAVLLNHVEHWTTERQLFSWGCKNAPDVNTNGCILLAARLIEDGMPEDALKAYEKVERLKDKSSAAVWETFSYPRMMHGRALALSNLGRHRDSIRTLQVMTENKKAKGSDHTNIQIMTKVPALLAMSYLRLGQIQEARSVVQKDILPLQNGVKLAASFEKLAADVSRIINELNSDYEKPLSELSDTSLQKTMQLARLLDDRWMMTVSAVEALRRGRLNEQSQKSAIFYLEKKGICSAASSLFENSGITLERCAAVPEAVTQ